MIRIISQEYIHPKEIEILCWLIDSGLDFYHFRKNNVCDTDCIAVLHRIPFAYRKNIVVHHHFNIDGFLYHHKSDERQYEHKNIHSCSAHQFDEVIDYLTFYNHVFWSPVFDSISKQGYFKNTTIDLGKVKPHLRPQLIALGGVQPSKFEMVKQIGFSQIAIKGWFWNEPNYKQAWREIRTTWQELEKTY